MVELIGPEGGLTEARLVAAEQRLGVRLPDDYRNFMLKHNGGRPKPAGFDIVWNDGQEGGEYWGSSEVSRFLAIHDGEKANFLDLNEIDFRGRLPANTIAIAQDPGGNVILLAVAGPLANQVRFWVKDLEVEQGDIPGFDNVGFIADSFDDLFNHKLR